MGCSAAPSPLTDPEEEQRCRRALPDLGYLPLA